MSLIILLILIIPLITTGLLYLPLKKSRFAEITVISSVIVFILTVIMAWYFSSADYVYTVKGNIHNWITVDAFSALILLLIALVATTASIYSIGYMSHGNISFKKLRLYYVNYNLFVFSMLAIPLIAEPTLVWIMVELTTLCSALLVSFENTKEALEAAWKYVVLSLMGAGMALFGFLVLYAAMQASGSSAPYTWSGLLTAAAKMPPPLLITAFLLIFIGFGAKVGLVPMHTWLPDAHSQAPSPVCALLSGIETTAILYVILRLFPVMKGVPHFHAGTWAIVIGLISVGTAAFLLLQVQDFKRMFAFSTIEHMGIILTAIGIGSSAADYGAMQQIVTHCVTKSFCFFVGGAVLLSFGTRKISEVSGLFKKSPGLGTAMVFGGLAITGAPPLAVFLSEFLIIKAGFVQKYYFVTALLAVFIVIAFFGIMKHVNQMVFGAQKKQNKRIAEEQNFHLPVSCRVAMILAAIPVLIFGFYIPEPLLNLLTQAAAVLMR